MTSATGAPPRRFASAGERVRKLLLRPEPAALVAFILLTVVFSIGSPIFLTTATFVSIMSVASELGIVAIGMTLLMIGGHFDLSVGAVLGLSSWFVVTLMNQYDIPAPIAFGAALVLAGFLGAINGFIVVKARMNAFVVTLGTMLVYRGSLIALTGGFPITVPIPAEVKAIAAGPLLPGGFQMSLVWFLLIVVGATVVLLRTRLGNWIQAAGQNPSAARNLGVPVDRITVMLFVQCSIMAGITGCIQVARFSTVDATRGQGIELQAIAVTVIGGTLLTGGYGSAIGTALGAVVFAMIGIGLVLNRVPGYYYMIIQGLIVLVAVSMNTLVRKGIAAAAPLGGLMRGGGSGAGPPAPSVSVARLRRSKESRTERTMTDETVTAAVSAEAGTPVEAIGISKYFGPTTALVDVSLTAHAGRIVALLGDNGAGKSTLIKIFSGVFPPDQGTLRFQGSPVRFRNPNDARARGIATCYQDLAVCELLSVTRNVVLGREPQRGIGPFRFFDVQTADRMTREALAKLGVRFERALDERGANLSGGERQSLAIARAMFFGSTCLILDEPTSALAVRQASTVLDHIATARDAGAAVILITHNFRHALSVADDIVVLAQGRVAGSFLRSETDLEQLTELVANVG